MISRRQWLGLLPLLLLTMGSRRLTTHPTPRAGITAARVLRPDQLNAGADVIEIFDMVRAIPQVVDGIYCYCGCAEIEGQYSLLSCFEADGMAQACIICQGEARMTYRLHREGASLDTIRTAIDRNFAR